MEETNEEKIECYFCSSRFAITKIDVEENIAFCPFCGTEMIDPVDISCPNPEDE